MKKTRLHRAVDGRHGPSRQWRWGSAAVIAALVSQSLVSADDWPAALVSETFSKSRDWFVRVVPGRSLGDTVGFAGSPKGPYARAEWYQRGPDRSYRLRHETTLANPVAPVKSLVTDRGYLVTLDNWHNMGYGTVVASYAPDGRKVTDLALENVFSAEEVRAFERSVSSIWWRKETAYVRDGQQSVYVAVNDKGAELILEPETGAWQYCDWRDGKHLCRSTNDSRVWRSYREPALRP
jgi:hypothetical protein